MMNSQITDGVYDSCKEPYVGCAQTRDVVCENCNQVIISRLWCCHLVVCASLPWLCRERAAKVVPLHRWFMHCDYHSSWNVFLATWPLSTRRDVTVHLCCCCSNLSIAAFTSPNVAINAEISDRSWVCIIHQHLTLKLSLTYHIPPKSKLH